MNHPDRFPLARFKEVVFVDGHHCILHFGIDIDVSLPMDISFDDRTVRSVGAISVIDLAWS